MCFFGGGGNPPTPPTPVAPPTPAPAPVPTPSVTEVAAQGETRRKQLEQLRYGFASTLKNSGGARGILDTPALAPDQTKNKLG